MKSGKEVKRLFELLIAVPVAALLVIFVCEIMTFDSHSDSDVIAFILTILLIIGLIVTFFVLRPRIDASFLDYSMRQGEIQRELLEEMTEPYALMDSSGQVIWANKQMKAMFGIPEKRSFRRYINYYFSSVDMEIFSREWDEREIEAELSGRTYSLSFKRIDVSEGFGDEPADDTDAGKVISDALGEDESLIIEPKSYIESAGQKDDTLIAMLVTDITELKTYITENYNQKLIAGLLYIDNYDEVMNTIEDVKQTVLMTLVDRKINMYLANLDAITKRMENDKYFFVIRQQNMDLLLEDKFSILQQVKEINAGNDMRITLSIGIGQGYDKYSDAYEAAKVAIGLGLGRGGDQVVIKNGNAITYYGGKSAGVEKATRVKARVKAQAFEELLQNMDKVIIMAHQRPDADAFGSAVGIYRLCTTLGKKSYIILNSITSTIEPVVSTFTSSSIYEDMIINNEAALNMLTKSTLVVVCDVNRPSMTECEEIIGRASNLVVFDHHRQTSEAITNATLSYIEPFASSACEMITEMFQYISVKPKIRPVEADAMYMGILIDTDNFLNKTGVRTFEAASYLRNAGADITRVRKMMRSSIEEMKEQASGISSAELFMDKYALSFVEPEPGSTEAPTTAAAKVANQLLNVKGVRASFVATEKDGTLYVSARSVGDVNVQVIMEKWSGGGHANIAGAQIKDMSIRAFMDELKGVLREMEIGGDI